jgi:hypothetical protein
VRRPRARGRRPLSRAARGGGPPAGSVEAGDERG